MKKILSNNDGYTLFIVLMTIVVFTILTLSFTVQTASSKKQNIIVEENYQSKALAEMGSQYYMTAIKNEFDEMKQIAETTQEEFLSNYEPEDITEQVIQLARQKGIEAAYSHLSSLVFDPTIGFQRTKNVNDGGTSPKFLIENVQLSSLIDNHASIIFDSVGIENGVREMNDTIVNGELEIDLSNMIINPPTKEEYEQLITDGPNLIPDPALNNELNDCSIRDFTGEKNGSVKSEVIGEIKCNSDKTIFKIIGNITYNKMIDSIAILYVTGTLTDESGNAKYQNIHIHVKGEATFGNINNNSDDTSHHVKIEVLKKASFGNLNSSKGILICAKEYGSIGEMNKHSDVDFYYNSNCPGKPDDTSNPTNPDFPKWDWDIPMVTKEEYEYN